MAKEIEFIYVVPSDRSTNPEYLVNYEWAAREAKRWFGTQPGDGDTLLLTDPIITVWQGTELASWYDSNDAFNCTFNRDYACNIWNDYIDNSGTGAAFLDTEPYRHFICDAPFTDFNVGGLTHPDRSFSMQLGTHLESFSPQSTASSRELALATMCHELGHMMGFDHGANDDTLMDASRATCLIQGDTCSFRASEITDLETDGWCETTPKAISDITNLASFQGMASI